MSEDDRMPPRVKLVLCLGLCLVIAWLMVGCGSGGGGADGGACLDPNAMTPDGVPVHESAALQRLIDADPTLEPALFAEIDTYGVPPHWLVVIGGAEKVDYPGDAYDTVHGYTTCRCNEIHAGLFATPPYLRVVPHEVEHAECGCCYCTPGHAGEPRCQ